MKAVLVIDMLEDFFRDWQLAESRFALCANINVLTGWARRGEVPVIWVRQGVRDDLSGAFLVMRKRNIRVTVENTPGCRILAELERGAEDSVIVRKRYSPFFGTDLVVQQAWRGRGIGRALLEGAELCALNLIAQLKVTLDGDLERLVRSVRLAGYVNAAADFAGHSQVINGASDLFVNVFGETGRHTRMAIDVAGLPYNAAVEVEALCQVR